MKVMIEKGFRGGIWEQHIGMLRQIINIIEVIIKTLSHHILNI